MNNDISLTNQEKKCVLRFLYHIASSDFQVVREELDVILSVAKEIGIEIEGSESWLTSPWALLDANNLSSIMIKSTELTGWLVAQATKVMNADHIMHRNERIVIMELANKLFGNQESPKAIEIPIENLSSNTHEMIVKTADLCLAKEIWWQKKKSNEKSIKRVGASLSWTRNGEEKYVTAVNYELSSPGGSRCAEQNAIGMAIANEPDLRFEEINEIVVYGAGGLSNPCWPCGVCMENLRKLNNKNQIRIYGYPAEYIYESGRLPSNMLELSVSKLNQRQGEKIE